MNIEEMFEQIGNALDSKQWEKALLLGKLILQDEPENEFAHISILLAEARVSSISELKNITILLEELGSYKNALKYSEPSISEYIKKCNDRVKASIESQTIDIKETTPKFATIPVNNTYNRNNPKYNKAKITSNKRSGGNGGGCITTIIVVFVLLLLLCSCGSCLSSSSNNTEDYLKKQQELNELKYYQKYPHLKP